MKKLVFVLLPFFFFAQNISAIVADDYYLNNRPAIEVSNRAENIMPNTLRMELHEGESETVTVSLLPEKTRDNAIMWQLRGGEGVVEIYPDGKNCTVRAVSEGENILLARTYGGAETEIAIRIIKPQETRLRNFELEEEVEKETVFTEKIMQNIIRFLITFSVMLIFAAVVLYLKAKREEE
ncbi:MAG: hypothetical protein IKU65_06765 [Oscillospiraceae bacterium]|nr:hypothetical protein [Oscillospiraceae bacterium]